MASAVPNDENSLEQIWEGDKLERRAEAQVLQRFLVSESETMLMQERDQAVVLALDAQYGEGKSWFLSRFRRQLTINHPVAFVDAWVDDANNEPLVSIMAALDEALQPFLSTKAVRDKLTALTRAALPIIGKAAVGAGGKFVGKYFGDQFGEDAREIVAGAAKADEGGPLDAALDATTAGISAVVDNAAKEMLQQYRTRQRSRETFKNNLRQLGASINQNSADPRRSPMFVVIDELDRCRPTYAISLLEEVKHLFDVPGVVFIIALHGKQLTESIKAVYGTEFDAQAYLRRFFSRHYELRRLSIRELIVSHFAWVPLDGVTFSSPQIIIGNDIVSPSAVELVGELLTDWQVTPREGLAVVDGLRLFVVNWDHKVPIEIPLVLVMLLHLVRGNDVVATHPKPGHSKSAFVVPGTDSNGSPLRVGVDELLAEYSVGIGTPLQQIIRNDYERGALGYVSERMQVEFSQRFSSSVRGGQKSPMSTWSEYRDRVRGVGRFLEPSEDESQ
jgi:hypothetical protein